MPLMWAAWPSGHELELELVVAPPERGVDVVVGDLGHHPDDVREPIGHLLGHGQNPAARKIPSSPSK